LEFFADSLPRVVLVFAGDRVGEDRQGDGAETAEPGQDRFLVAGCGPILGFDRLERFDGGEDVAGLGLFAAGRLSQWPIRAVLIDCLLVPRIRGLNDGFGNECSRSGRIVGIETGVGVGEVEERSSCRSYSVGV